MASEFTIKEATFDDWKRLVDLSTETNRWSFAYEDFSVWTKAFGEEKSKFLAAKGPDGDVLGFVGLGKLEPNITIVGLHYVQAAHRGKGIGTQIFDEITKDSVEEGRNICLNGEFRISDKYAGRKGFDRIAEWNVSILTIDKGVDTSKIAHLAGNINVVNASDGDFDKVAVFDRTVAANIDRLQWIGAWLNHQAGWSKIALDTNGSVIGYGTVRRVTLNRLVVGPLYANDKNTAAALIKALLDYDKDIATRQVQFFSPSTNEDLFDLLEVLSGGNCEDDGYFVSQFTKQLLDIDVCKVFSVSDHALMFI